MKRGVETEVSGTTIAVTGRFEDVTKEDLDRWCAVLWHGGVGVEPEEVPTPKAADAA